MIQDSLEPALVLAARPGVESRQPPPVSLCLRLASHHPAELRFLESEPREDLGRKEGLTHLTEYFQGRHLKVHLPNFNPVVAFLRKANVVAK